jgi:hypothetical protein
MEEKNLMIFPDLNQEEFDFNSLVGNKQYGIMAGIPVKIDRIIRDITQTTVIAVSGTMVLKGVKMRGVWDMYGNIEGHMGSAYCEQGISEKDWEWDWDFNK